MEFTTQEIRDQLSKLGYHNVPLERLELFKKDLDVLVSREQSKDTSAVSSCIEAQGVYSTGMPGMLAPSRFEPQHRLINKPPVVNIGGWTNKETTIPPSTIQQPCRTQPSSQINYDPYRPFPSQKPVSSIHFQSHPRPAGGKSRSFVQRDKPADFSLYSDSDRLSQLNSDALDTTTESERQRVVMKRKVLRKQNGESVVFDESVTESELDDVSSLQERLANMPISITRTRPSSAPPSTGCAPRNTRPEQQPCYRLPDDFAKPKALIKPMTCAPHLRHMLRSDPVARYAKYNSGWRAQRTPGEKSHAELRWSVREQLLQKDDPCEKRPQKCYVPNNYVVPTDKKRKTLRWQMRHDLAQGIVPPSAFD